MRRNLSLNSTVKIVIAGETRTLYNCLSAIIEGTTVRIQAKDGNHFFEFPSTAYFDVYPHFLLSEEPAIKTEFVSGIDAPHGAVILKPQEKMLDFYNNPQAPSSIHTEQQHKD